MYWSDGTIYRGYWVDGQQEGLGMMIFKDGMRKAGFFENNIYVEALTSMKDFDDFVNKSKVPETFR